VTPSTDQVAQSTTQPGLEHFQGGGNPSSISKSSAWRGSSAVDTTKG